MQTLTHNQSFCQTLWHLCLATLLCAAVAPAALAVPAAGKQVRLVQPDGAELRAQVFGDERFLLVRTEDGYTILQEPDGFWYYATLDAAGQLTSTPFRVGSVNPAQAGLPRNLAPAPDEIRRQRAARVVREKAYRRAARGIPYSSFPNLSGELGPKATSPLTGTARTLVILVEFAESAIHTKHVYSNEEIETHLFSVAQRTPGSMSDYYSEVSFGQFTVTGDVYGWVMAPQPYSYYVGADSGAGTDFPNNSQGLLLDILTQIDPVVDFSAYDQNNDGYVDSITLVFEGMATGSRLLLWPHAWALGQFAFRTNDGVTVDAYNIANEQDNDGSLEPIGTFVHEFGHVLGAPDLYDYDSGSLYALDDNDHPVRDWGLMGTGNYGHAPGEPSSTTPSHFSGFVAYYWFGWRPAVDITSAGTYTITQSGANPSTATTLYRIPMNSTGTEYLLIENRWASKTSRFDHYDGDGLALDDGLLIYHIDEAMVDEPENAFFNDGTPLRAHYGCRLLDAAQPRNVSDAPGETRADAAWSADDNQILLSPYTRPFNTDTYAQSRTNISISRISNAGATMTFTVSFDGTADTTGLPLTLTAATAQSTYAVGDKLGAKLSIDGQGAYDFYLALQIPDGSLWTVDLDGNLHPTGTLQPLLTAWDMETLSDVELSLFPIPDGAPSGTYTFYFAAQEPLGNPYLGPWKNIAAATFEIP